MRILGIDPSLSSTGWAIVEDGKVVDYGTIKTKVKDGALEERIVYIADKIWHICSRRVYEHIAIEDVFVNRRNVNTSIKLAKLQGAIIKGIPCDGTRIKVYAPAFVKQAVTANGNASKEQVMKMVKIMTGYKGKSDDESDAIAVALTCEREIQNERR